MKRILAVLVAVAGVSAAGCYQNLNPVDLSDSGISARMKAELQAHPEINVQYLDLDTHVGVVTISGIVSSIEDKEAIVRLANRLKGVKQVIANLVLRQ